MVHFTLALFETDTLDTTYSLVFFSQLPPKIVWLTENQISARLMLYLALIDGTKEDIW